MTTATESVQVRSLERGAADGSAQVDNAIRCWNTLREAQERVERLTEDLHRAVGGMTDEQRSDYVRRTTR